MRGQVLALLAIIACGKVPAPASDSHRDVTIAADGRSDEIRWPWPAGARGVLLSARGSDAALLAVDLLQLDGETLAQPVASVHDALTRSVACAGRMPGALPQLARYGLFTLLVPTPPTGPPNLLRVRFLSDMPGAVRVALTPAHGPIARPARLQVRIVTLSPATLRTDFMVALQLALQAAQLPAHITTVAVAAPPQLNLASADTRVTPHSPWARLPTLAPPVPSGSIDVFVVGAMPPGVRGLALATPGPGPATMYSGVVIADMPDANAMAHTAAHEIGHYLGLWHPQDVCEPHEPHTDGLADTAPLVPNLMNGTGTMLTDSQIAIVHASPWFVP